MHVVHPTWCADARLRGSLSLSHKAPGRKWTAFPPPPRVLLNNSVSPGGGGGGESNNPPPPPRTWIRSWEKISFTKGNIHLAVFGTNFWTFWVPDPHPPPPPSE